MKQLSGQGAGGAPAAARPPRRGNALIPLVLGVFLVINLVRVLFFHENKFERLATDVTHAIAKNDMRPVEKDFNAIRRPQLEDRAKVGSLSDFVNADGALRSVKEQSASGAKVGQHRFIATFEKGKRSEDLTVDADGKIVDFHVTPYAGT